jgi:hypothetical protein
MIRTLAALERLRGEPENLRQDPVCLRIDPHKECAELLGYRDALRKEAVNFLVPQSPLEPKQVWKYWQACGFDLDALDGLQIRTLCTCEETALEPALIAELGKRPQILRRSICLFGIAVAYFSKWRTMASPELVERLLNKSLSSAEKPGSVLSMWRRHQNLFSRDAAEYLAQEIVNGKREFREVLDEKLVPLTSSLSVAVSARAAELAVTNFRQKEASLNEEQKMQELRWLVANTWGAPVPTESFYAAASNIVMSKAAEQSDLFRSFLTETFRVDSRLGDPRLRPNEPKWRGMETPAAQRFLSWLARDNILFFFNTILPDTSENRRRKTFWLTYHRAIRDFQVAISEQDLWKLKRTLTTRELPLYSRVSRGTASAFVMRFSGAGRDFVVVEFSETGNAAYIHEWKTFESKGITLRTREFDFHEHLKYSGRLDRVLHLGNWELAARHSLATLGIRP